MNKPAPTNNNAETATCTTSNPLLKRDRLPVVRPLCFNVEFKSRLVARHAGASPNRRPVSNDTASVNPSTRQFRLSPTPLGNSPLSSLVNTLSAPLNQKAKSAPTAPQSVASSKLSDSN